MMNINWCGSEENDGIDRISALPDDTRTHILSFLRTREAVQTCILSKRWINTWASVSDLKFDIQEFGLLELENFDEDMVVEFVTKFNLLVKNVLMKRETSFVNRFQLWMDCEDVFWPCSQILADYIGDVMKLKPQECSVKLCLCETLNLHTDLIFTSASLIYLELCFSIERKDIVTIEPTSVNLHCLKTLNLNGVEISNNSFPKLLSGCPVLEELLLDNCYIDFIEICSNTLKKLVLHSLDHYYEKRLHISTPNLLYFNINYFGMRDTLLLNMSSLVHASIFFPSWYDQDEYVIIGPKLIHSLSNVESLQLTLDYDYPIRKIQKKVFSNCSTFDNLKSLELLVNWNMCATEFVDEEITQGGPEDALVQREFLKTIRILGIENNNEFVDKLINKLLIHVKVIGEIIV